MVDELKDLVKEAQAGSELALEDLVRVVQDPVHHLAMRMLVDPDDALEATQEILILVVTKLSTFKGESKFLTWVYRVATNYLLNAKKSLAREKGLSFEAFGADLEDGLLVDQAPLADDVVLLNELRISCTMAMLLCLDLPHRVAYVLGDVLELDHLEASDILEISKDNFRQRLARARKQVFSFSSSYCGVVSSEVKCSCSRRLPKAVELGRVNKQSLVYSIDGAPSYEDVLSEVKTVESDLKALKSQSATAFYKSPCDLAMRISEIVSWPT
jgi:RNA polymerase sigma factor (sigma-70 family)